MVAIPLDKINYNKMFKYAKVLYLKELYPKTKNVSYYLKEFIGSGHILPVCTLAKYDIGTMLLHTYGLKTTIACKRRKNAQKKPYMGHARIISLKTLYFLHAAYQHDPYLWTPKPIDVFFCITSLYMEYALSRPKYLSTHI